MQASSMVLSRVDATREEVIAMVGEMKAWPLAASITFTPPVGNPFVARVNLMTEWGPRTAADNPERLRNPHPYLVVTDGHVELACHDDRTVRHAIGQLILAAMQQFLAMSYSGGLGEAEDE